MSHNPKALDAQQREKLAGEAEACSQRARLEAELEVGSDLLNYI